MFPEPTELLLIGCSIESIWTPRSKPKYIDTKNQLADILTRNISHVMSGIIFLCLFNISHFSSTNCLEVMSKRTQEDAGEERVTAKSKPMINLVSRYSARDPKYLLRLHLTAWRKPDLKVKNLWARGMSSNQERGDLWWALVHQNTQNGTLTRSDLLKSGNLVKCWKQERGDLWVCHSSPRTQTSLSSITMIWTLTPPQNRTFR